MTYLFHELDKLCSAFNFSTNYPQGHACLMKNFRSETDKIRTQLKDVYFKPHCQHTFEKFVSLHHTALVERLDDLSLLLKNSSEASGLSMPTTLHEHKEAILSAYALLSDLLEFLHTCFSLFLPKHLPIPRQSLQAPVQEIREAKEFVELVLNTSCGIELKNLIIKPFDDFLSGENNHTWHQLFYCRALHTELQWLIENVQPNTESLMWMLYRLNYNDPSFYYLLTTYIRQLDGDNYLETLYDTRRKIRQLLIVPNLFYREEQASIGKLVENWLSEEIAYIIKTAKLPMKVETVSGLPEIVPAEKLQANMSVAELACLFKVMSDSGLIKIPNYKEFFQSVVSTYRTKQSPTISAESFRTKFYSSEPGIKKTVKQYIITLMNQINLNP